MRGRHKANPPPQARKANLLSNVLHQQPSLVNTLQSRIADLEHQLENAKRKLHTRDTSNLEFAKSAAHIADLENDLQEMRGEVKRAKEEVRDAREEAEAEKRNAESWKKETNKIVLANRRLKDRCETLENVMAKTGAERVLRYPSRVRKGSVSSVGGSGMGGISATGGVSSSQGGGDRRVFGGELSSEHDLHLNDQRTPVDSQRATDTSLSSSSRKEGFNALKLERRAAVGEGGRYSQSHPRTNSSSSSDRARQIFANKSGGNAVARSDNGEFLPPNDPLEPAFSLLRPPPPQPAGSRPARPSTSEDDAPRQSHPAPTPPGKAGSPRSPTENTELSPGDLDFPLRFSQHPADHEEDQSPLSSAGSVGFAGSGRKLTLDDVIKQNPSLLRLSESIDLLSKFLPGGAEKEEKAGGARMGAYS